MGYIAPCLIAIYVNRCGDNNIKITICLTKLLQTLLLIFHLCKYIWSYNMIWYFTNSVFYGSEGLEDVHNRIK